MVPNKRNAKLKIKLLPILAAVLLVCTLQAGCGDDSIEERGSRSRPIPVRTTGLERGDLPYELELTGEITAPEKAQIAPTVGGRIDRITVRMGDRIKLGETLVKMDVTILSAQYAEAKAGLTAAEAAVERARSEYENASADLLRTEALMEKGFVSQQELDTVKTRAAAAKADLDYAAAQHDQSRARRQTASAQLSEATITAPFDGMVEERFLDPGNVVSAGTSILAVTRTSPAVLRFSIPERHIGAVAEAMNLGTPSVELSVDAFPGETFSGQIARIAPVIEPGSRSRTVEAEIPNDDSRLLPGMYARLRLRLGAAQNALLLPLDALMNASSNGQETERGATTGDVFVVRDGKAILTPVKIGLRKEDLGELLEGLVDSDRIVIEGQHLLLDGAAVKTESADRSDAPDSAEGASGRHGGE